ncbi:MAG: MerC domain-containing protein [Pseudomonadota bacterium]
MNPRQDRSKAADVIAIGLSGACLMHCVLLPVVVAVSPVFALAAEEWVHKVLVLIAAPISISVLARAQRRPERLILAVSIGVGLASLFAGAFVEPLHHYEQPLTVFGALVIGTSHAVRWWRHSTSMVPPA